MMDRAIRYTKAIATWTMAGMPVRSNHEVASIFAVCAACDHFNGRACTVCGCSTSTSAIAFVNKIKMATEKCPKDKW